MREPSLKDGAVRCRLMSSSFPSVKLTKDGKFFSFAFMIALDSVFRIRKITMKILFNIFNGF